MNDMDNCRVKDYLIAGIKMKTLDIILNITHVNM